MYPINFLFSKNFRKLRTRLAYQDYIPEIPYYQAL